MGAAGYNAEAWCASAQCIAEPTLQRGNIPARLSIVFFINPLGERLADDPLHQLARLEGGRGLDLIDEGERDGRDRRRPMTRQLLDRGAAVEEHGAKGIRRRAQRSRVEREGDASGWE